MIKSCVQSVKNAKDRSALSFKCRKNDTSYWTFAKIIIAYHEGSQRDKTIFVSFDIHKVLCASVT